MTKTSQWIKYNENDGCDCWGRPEYVTKYKCNCCGYTNNTKTNFCPNCGVQMIDEVIE